MTSDGQAVGDSAERELALDALAAWEPWQQEALDGVRRLEAAVREGRRDEATRVAGAASEALQRKIAGDGVRRNDAPPVHRRAAVEALSSAVTAAYLSGDMEWAQRVAEALCMILGRDV